MSKAPAKILIVDDHPIVRRGLSDVIAIQPDLEVCGEAAGPSEVLSQLGEKDVDLVVVDISLKAGDGLDLIKQIRSRHQTDVVKVLVWSMHDETLFAERALRAGATGYVSKGEATEEIVSAIRQVLEGKIYVSERMADRLMRRAISGAEDPTSPVMSLTDRELQVFELIGQALTTRQIAEKLHLSPKTIETYRENIKTKLKLDNSAELMQHAVKWVLEES